MDHEQEPGSDLGAEPGEGEFGQAAESALDMTDEPTVIFADDDEDAADDDADAPIELDEKSAAAEAAPPMAHVRADNVTLSQGGAQSIEASTVSITQGGAGAVRADELTISQGGIGLARTGSLTVQSEASAFAIVADKATVEEGASVFLLIARSTDGEVRPTIDWRAGLAFGVGFAVALKLIRRIR